MRLSRLVKVDRAENHTERPQADENKKANGQTKTGGWQEARHKPANLRSDDDDAEVNADGANYSPWRRLREKHSVLGFSVHRCVKEIRQMCARRAEPILTLLSPPKLKAIPEPLDNVVYHLTRIRPNYSAFKGGIIRSNPLAFGGVTRCKGVHDEVSSRTGRFL